MQPNDVSKVSHIPLPTPGRLYLASKNILENHQDHNIDHIVTVLSSEHIPAKISGIKHDIYVLDDDFSRSCLSRMKEILEETAPRIHHSLTEGKNVAVHCYMGISRSATVVLHYLLTHHMRGQGLNTACRFLRNHRPVVSPNIGFQQLLREKHE